MTTLSAEVANLVSSINSSGTEAEQRAARLTSSTAEMDSRGWRLSDRTIELRAEIKELEKIKEGKDYEAYLTSLNEEIKKFEILAEQAEERSRRIKEVLSSSIREQMAMKSLFKKYGVLKIPKKVLGLIEVMEDEQLGNVTDVEKVRAFLPLYEEELESPSTKDEVNGMMKEVNEKLSQKSFTE